MGKLWEKAGQVEFDNNGVVAGACEARFFVGGTTTPLVVYSDAAETTPRAVPAVADANGRWPVTFIPFTAAYDVQVTTEGGTQLYYYTNIPNPDPVEASEDSVDDTELIQTGDIISSTKTGTRAGFVRVNGRTIGSAASSATERANDDTEDLYTFLYDEHDDGICAVVGGRGANAESDFAANKPITLFNGRSAFLVGLDDMGNTAAGLGFGGTFVTGDAVTGGSLGGANTHTLQTTEAPAHTHSFSATTGSDGSHSHTGTTANESAAHSHNGTSGTNNQDIAHTHTYQVTNYAGGGDTGGAFAAPTSESTTNTGSSGALTHDHSFTTDQNSSSHTHTFTTSTGGSHTHTVSGTSGSTGGGGAHNNMPRALHVTYYIKL